PDNAAGAVRADQELEPLRATRRIANDPAGLGAIQSGHAMGPEIHVACEGPIQKAGVQIPSAVDAKRLPERNDPLPPLRRMDSGVPGESLGKGRMAQKGTGVDAALGDTASARLLPGGSRFVEDPPGALAAESLRRPRASGPSTDHGDSHDLHPTATKANLA